MRRVSVKLVKSPACDCERQRYGRPAIPPSPAGMRSTLSLFLSSSTVVAGRAAGLPATPLPPTAPSRPPPLVTTPARPGTFATQFSFKLHYVCSAELTKICNTGMALKAGPRLRDHTESSHNLGNFFAMPLKPKKDVICLISFSSVSIFAIIALISNDFIDRVTL